MKVKIVVWHWWCSDKEKIKKITNVLFVFLIRCLIEVWKSAGRIGHDQTLKSWLVLWSTDDYNLDSCFICWWWSCPVCIHWPLRSLQNPSQTRGLERRISNSGSLLTQQGYICNMERLILKTKVVWFYFQKSVPNAALSLMADMEVSKDCVRFQTFS